MNPIKNQWHYYLAFILFVLGIFFVSRGHSLENPHAIKHIQIHLHKALLYENCKTNKQKYLFHKENGDRCLEDAKNRCWYLPNLTDRDNARYCWSNAAALLYPGTPVSKVVAVIITTLTQYGIDCNGEWDYIHTKLYWSQYHYEMMEFYKGLI